MTNTTTNTAATTDQDTSVEVEDTSGHLWVLAIDHRYSTDLTIHRTEDGARDHLYNTFVSQWWNEEVEIGAGSDQSLPSDRDTAITTYFDTVEEEFYSIQSCPVLG